MSEREKPSAAANPLCGESSPPQYNKPHIPERCRAGLTVANAGKPLAALDGNAEAILERLRQRESVKDIADSLGVSDVTVYGFLLRHAPDQWMEISAGKSLARIEKAADDLDTAEDQLTVSRARESARLAQWDLERAARKLYGDNKSENTGVTVNVIIDRGTDGVTIEGKAA